MKKIYFKAKRFLAILLCFTVLVTSMAREQKEVKAIAPAVVGVGALVVGALGLASGLAIKDKVGLNNMASDFSDWLEDKVPETFKDFVNLVSNPSQTGKLIISTGLTTAFTKWLQSKGWGGETAIDSVNATLSDSSYAKYLYLSRHTAFKDNIGTFSCLIHTDTAYDPCYYDFYDKYESGKYFLWSYIDHYFLFLPVNLTDVVISGKLVTLISSDGNEEVLNCNDSLEDLIAKGYYAVYYDLNNRGVPYNAVVTASLHRDLTSLVRWKSNRLPKGIRIWNSMDSYATGDVNRAVYVTGEPASYSVPVNGVANPAYQTVDTVIPVNSINNMTIDQFTALVDKAIADNMTNYADVITGELIGDFVDDDTTGTGDNTGDSDNDDDNKKPIGGDFIIPGLGIQWFTDLADKVGSIPQTIKDSISDLFLKFEFAYEDFKEWLATEIKSIPTAIKEVVTSIKDIPTNISKELGLSGYFDKVIDAIHGIDLTGLLTGVLAIPGYIQALPSQFASWFEQIISGIKDIPAQFVNYFDRVIDAIKAIPSEFKNWLETIIEKLTELCEVVKGIFALDMTQINVATAELVDVVNGRFVIWGQLKILADIGKRQFDESYPVIYMQPPSLIKPLLEKNPSGIYDAKKGMIVCDLSNYKDLFKWGRLVASAFAWFLVFRWLLRKFDFNIVITP